MRDLDSLLEQAAAELLGERPQTLDALYRGIARTSPPLVVNGPAWLRRWLTRNPRFRLDGDRWTLRQAGEDEDLDEEPTAEATAVERSIARQYVVLDLETNPDRTDPADHEIIEVAAARVVDGVITDRFTSLVHNRRPLIDLVTDLTGITAEDLADAPQLSEILPRFLDFLGDDALICHNGMGYDFLVLDASCAREELPAPAGTRLDTLDLAHVAFPRAGETIEPDADGGKPPRGRRLEDLAVYLGVYGEPQTHRALDDVHLLCAVLEALVDHLSAALPRWELVRHVLAGSGHPWAAFLPEPGERPDLLDTLPPALPVVPIPATAEFDLDETVGLLEPGGALVVGRSHRPQQVKMAYAVGRALGEGQQLLVEAPTGTGKTFAYLVPAVAYARACGQPVVVATHSKVLQNQVLSAIPELEEAVGPINVVLLKGKENYLALESLDGAIEEGAPTPDDGLALAIMTSWAAATPTGEWDDLRVYAIEPRMPSFGRLRYELRVEDDGTFVEDDLQARCFYRRARIGIESAEIAVLNHAVMVSRTDWREHAGDLVLDEAHNLEEAATGAFTEEVTEADVLRVLDFVHPPRGRRGVLRRWAKASHTSRRGEAATAIRKLVADARTAAEDLTGVLVEFLRERAGARRDEVEQFGASVRLVEYERRRPLFAAVRTGAATLRRSLLALAEALEQLPVPAAAPTRERARVERRIARSARDLRGTAKIVGFVVFGDESEFGDAIPIADLQLDGGRYTWGLRAVPVSVAGRLRAVWDDMDAVVLTSATLQVRGDFGFIQERLGLDRARAMALDTPFTRLRENELVVLTSHLPAPTGHLIDRFTIAQTDELARLFTLTSGRALALFAARSRMQHARDHVRPLLDQRGITVLCQGDAPSPALVERMRTELTTSLLATRSFWEGVDVPGAYLSLLVIEKLPFDSPGDPVVAARMERLELEGRDPFEHYLVPQAAIRFAQGVGRLIRTDEDRGVVVVLDKRLRDPKPYRDAFLSALPGNPTIVRPMSAEEAYQRIAEFLHVPWDDSVRTLLATLPTSDPWGFLAELQISDEEAKDERLVLGRLAIVRDRLEFEEWREGQLEVMLRLIRGEDVVAILPTGSGKSITYQIPALLRPGVTLVVSPLIALMRDQVRTLQQRGIVSVAAIESGVGQAQQEEILASARAGLIRLLYVSPERLWSQRFRTAITDLDLARVIVDEAHVISQWGHSFRPEYAAIADAVRQMVSGRQDRPVTGAFTATATSEVQEEVRSLLEIDAAEDVVTAPDRPELQYYLIDCDDFDDRDVTVIRIVEAFRDQPVIVYVPKQKDTLRIAGLLRSANHRARPYHGGMESEERVMVEESFVDNEISVVVATKAFGLGIDKPDIAAIVHLEMPASVEEYIQETGRAARGAREGMEPKTGACVLLRTPRDCRIHAMFVKHSAPSLQVVQQVWEATRDGWTGPIEDVAPDLDEEEITMAASYLVRDGALERLDDVSWVGRLFVPRDAAAVVGEIGREDPAAADRFRQLLRLVDRIGAEEYHGARWSQAAMMSPAEIEQVVLEASRRGVVSFSSWQIAWQLVPTGKPPDWTRIRTEAEARRDKVKRLSDQAKAYRDNASQCRRSWLLWYLDADAEGACEGCDVCVPDLPRPWDDVDVDLETLQATLDPEIQVLALVAQQSEYGFGRTTYAFVLAGAPLKYNPHLAEHPMYGRLSSLRREGVAAIIDRLISTGELVEVERTRQNGSSSALELTEQGRQRLG